VRPFIWTQRHSRGFTLLEVLVAITILAFGLLAVVTMLEVSFSSGTYAKNTTKATELAAWMIDRVRQDSSLITQPYSTNITSLRSYDNDASAALVIDTSLAADPAREPGLTACQQWRSLLQGAAIANYMGANTLRGDRLPNGRGVMTIVPYDANNGGNHMVTVDVTWSLPGAGLIFRRFVRMETVLATAE